MKKILHSGAIVFALALAFCFSQVQIVNAATQSAQVQNTDQNTTETKVADATLLDRGGTIISSMPSLSIDSVELSSVSSIIQAGSEVSGTFTLTNHSSFPLTGLKYRTLIGTNYKEYEGGFKATDDFLDASSLVSMGDLDVGQTKKVNFKYKIPDHISGEKLAIQIHAYTDNTIILGMQNSGYLNIKSSTSGSISAIDIKVSLSNGKTFTTSEGPTIYKDREPKSIYLSATLKNKTKESIYIVPNIVAYNQQSSDELIKYSVGSISLGGGETKEVSIALSNFDYKPGVYFSEITLVDKNGKQLVGKIGVRYIIGGDIATIHTLTIDKQQLKSGEEFKADFTVTGRPLDISDLTDNVISDKASKEMKDAKKGTITIEIYNEFDKVVAQYSEPFNLYGDTSKSLNLIALNDAKAMKATVSIANENGQVFAKKDVVLNASFEDVAKTEKNKANIIKIFGIIIFALIIIIVILRIRRGKLNRAALIALAIVTSSSIPFAVNAWVWTNNTFMYATNIYGQTVYGDPHISVSYPYDYQHFTEGSAYTFYGSMYYLTCANSASRVSMHITESATGQDNRWVVSQRPQLGGEAVWDESTNFASPAVYVGNISGLHLLYFTARNINGGLNDTTSGYVPYYVDCASGRAPDANGYCAYVPVNGSCGSINGSSLTSAPVGATSSTYCSNGSIASVTSSTSGGIITYRWQCAGSNGGTSASCSYNMASSCVSNNSCGNSGTTTTTTTATTTTIGGGGLAICGVAGGTPVALGSSINSSSSGLCGSGSSLSGSISLNYSNSEWRWTCVSGSTSALCKTSCTTGTSYCPITGACSLTCVDWCSNMEGYQTNKDLYTIDASGQCTNVKLIKNFKLSPSITDSQGVCKAFWSTKSPTNDEVTCKINGTKVDCDSAIGYNVQPGLIKFEAFIRPAVINVPGATSTILTDTEELRCTKNPNFIEL